MARRDLSRGCLPVFLLCNALIVKHFFFFYVARHRTQVVEKAKADAEKIKLIGAAEATAIENIGRAEAEAMRLKAAAYKQYGEAATLSLVIEALPKVTQHSPCSLETTSLFSSRFSIKPEVLPSIQHRIS